MEKYLKLNHGTVDLPVFLPDATFGYVRALSTADLRECGVECLMMNVFHLVQHPGSSVIKQGEGLHNLCSWSYPLATDSGGFQAYSLIKENPKFGSITDKGIIIKLQDSGRKINFNPDKNMCVQLDFGADIVFALDDCTHSRDAHSEQVLSVERTIKWARKSKLEYEQYLDRFSVKNKPKIFAVIQGGRDRELRRRCAEALLEIGFDGYGYGGYPLDDGGNLLADMLEFTRNLVPRCIPMIALGIGEPANIIAGAKLGYGLFDCSLPTRDARQGRLCVFEKKPADIRFDTATNWVSYLYIKDLKHIKSNMPISEFCTCAACKNYTRAFLHHIYKQRDALYFRLASIHNLSFITTLMNRLRKDAGLFTSNAVSQ